MGCYNKLKIENGKLKIKTAWIPAYAGMTTPGAGMTEQ
jgi:hypothetical protein